MNINITLEEALQRASRGLQEKMLHSVELLRKAERIARLYDRENGYYLAFSGGKDSQALMHIAQLAGVQFASHMNLTSVDPPEVIRFVKRNYPEVELIKPVKSIYQFAVEKQILPTMRVRWCCAEFKESAGAGKVTLIGIRKAESSRRAKRNEVEISDRKFSGDFEGFEEYRKKKLKKKNRGGQTPSVANPEAISNESVTGCIRGKDSLLVSPIIYWTEKDVWEFLNHVVCVPHCSLYDEGWHRLGCIGCPMSSAKQKRIENERYPHVKRNWIKAIKAIRRGGISTNVKMVEHQGGLETSQKRQRIAQDAGGWIQHPNPEHWMQRGSTGGRRPNSYQKDIWRKESKALQRKQRNMGGFSNGSSSVSLTEEQENEIAENIYDWWISGKPYKKWYADKFLQLKLDFGDF